MNVISKNVLKGVLVLHLGFTGFAQTPVHPEVPRFPDPIVVQIPQFTEVIATVTRQVPLSDADKANPIRLVWQPDLVQAVYIRDANNLSITNQWEGGMKSECYLFNGTVFCQPTLKYPKDIRVCGTGGGFGVPSFAHGDFSELSWIEPGNYVRTESHGGRSAYLFQRGHGQKMGDVTAKVKAPATANAPEPATALPEPVNTAAKGGAKRDPVAWLDAKTLLPLEFHSEELAYLYQYRKAPMTAIQPSPLFRPVIDRAGAMKKW